MELRKIAAVLVRGTAAAVLGVTCLVGQARATDKESSETEARAVVGRLIEEVQSGGDFVLFEKLFDPGFIDHTPFPGYSPDKNGALAIYKTFRTGFPDFRAEVHLQVVENGRVTSFKTYHGTHQGPFMGLAPTGRKIAIPIMDIVEVRNGRITAHWGVPNVLVLYQQLGVHRFDDRGAPLVDAAK